MAAVARRPVRLMAASLAAAVVALQLVATVPAGAAGGITVDNPSVGEPGDIGVTNELAFTVTRTSSGAQTVDYTTADGTAKAGWDYVATSGTLAFGAIETSKQVKVVVLGDNLDEGDETFSLQLSGASDGSPNVNGTGTIVDDNDPVPSISVANTTVREGNAGTVRAGFFVSLSNPSGRTVTVNYATADGTAKNPADYTATSGTLSFAPGQLSAVVAVPVVGDTLDEDDETFTLSLSSPDHATLANTTATGTILNDDTAPSISINDVVTPDEKAPAHFTVTLSAPSGRPVAVDVTAGGSLIPPSATPSGPAADFSQPSPSHLVFDPGITSLPLDIPIVDDTTDEPAEHFTVTLSNPQHATLGKAVGAGTITDDDLGPNIKIDDVSKVEGTGIPSLFDFTASLSGVRTTQTVTVDYAVKDGTAVAPGDYTVTTPPSATGQLTFLPGQTTKHVVVTVNPDTLAEGAETFTVELSNASVGINIDKAVGVGTILNDDGPPANVSVDDVTVSEGVGTGHFTVSLEKAVPAVVSVSYSMKNGTATDGSDFGGSSGVVTWGPNSTTPQTINFTVTQDNTYEADETFTVELANPINAVLAKGTGMATIINDDAAPTVSITPTLSVPEGNTGSTKKTLDVTLSAVSGLPAQVDFASAAVTATAGVDYSVDPPGTLTFAPGETSKQIQLSVNGDTLFEDNETFTVTLSNLQGASPGTLTGTVTITNDDTAPLVHIEAVAVTEPASATDTTPASFPVRLSAVSGKAVTVKYTTANGTATSGSDYVAVTIVQNKTVTIPAGAQSGAVVIDVKGDGTVDSAPDETFSVTLSNPVDATLDPAATSATGTIHDADGPPRLFITPAVTVNEGNTTATAVLSVSLIPASASSVTVHYATADGAAKAPGDYTAKPDTTLTFDPGQTVKTVSVTVIGDRIDEADEDFTVSLSNAGGATIATGQGTGTVTIRDDDGPTISVADLSVIEGNSGTRAAAFAVSLSAASFQPITVSYGTSDGTASAPADYTAASGTLTFAPGETTKTVNVNVVGDTIDEADEDFTLGLSSPSNATIARAQGRAVILDDDQPTVSVVVASSPSPGLAPTVKEGDDGFTPLTFNLTLDAATTRESSLDYATVDGTARAGADYVPVSGRLTFAPGETTKTVVVQVIGDVRKEADETFTLHLSGPANVTIAGNGVGTILDDDQPGYALVASDGGLFAFGSAGFFGSTGNIKLNKPIVGSAATPSGRGYWLVASDGGIFAFGDAGFFGSTGNLRLNQPIVAMAATPTGKGYWLVASDGGIFAFGDAVYQGSTGAIRLNRPVVGVGSTPSGKGYWLVATDGGIFAFGDATFQGSTGAIRLNRPVVGMGSTPSGKGYWLVATDGGIFAFGDATFQGSTGAIRLNRPVVGMASTPSGEGYWLVATDGGIFAFGDAGFLGSTGNIKLNQPIVAMIDL